MKLYCSNEVFQKACQTLIPCVLTDGGEITNRKELTPEELIEHQEEASTFTHGNWAWVENCIKPVGSSGWLVFAKNGKFLNCVCSFFDGTRHIYSVVIGNTRHKFKQRAYAVAACLAYT